MPEAGGRNRVALQRIRAWVGETIFKRGQDYQLRGRVRALAATSSGGLVAWVQGRARYATSLTLGAQDLTARCTCPYGGTCKHAVAVALAYLERSEQAPPLSVVAPDDPRLVLLEQMATAATLVATPPSIPAEPPGDLALRAFLSGLAQPELVELLLEQARRLPELRDALEVRQMLASDDADELEASVLARIVEAGAPSGWGERWHEAGHPPDYGPVYEGLQQLLDRGHADAVVRLGEELLETGIRQVEQTHDDGETGAAVGSCLTLVFHALPRSSLAPHEQLQWAIDALLRDTYDLCHGAQEVLEQPFPPAAWSIVADELLNRLEDEPVSAERDSFTRNYRRRRLADLAIVALEEAGRDEEIIALCEREAAKSGSYQRLVERLLAAGRETEAEHWALQGIPATERQYPGSASQLREVVCTLRAQVGDWAMVAALRAEAFFDRPTLQMLQTLEQAAEQAQVRPAVRAAALHYLATGEMPRREEHIVDGTVIPAWPLPDTGLPRAEQRYPLQFPQLGLLIELAASEGRPAEVLRWYDRRSPGRLFHINDDMVADTVAQDYPDRAAQIWQQLAEAHIAQTSPAAYQEAALFLRKLRRVWARQGQEAAWRAYVVELRAANRRKRRLVEVLDALAGQAN
ncbi:MAG TPA: SWIM zinc finger family protein [Roseiflexaceae bacterium]|jgi:uncharacterized Zn finger protein